MTYYKHDIEYITKYFTPGTEAVKIAPQEATQKAKTEMPKIAERPAITIAIDPVALCSVAVAFALIVMMLVSMVRFVAVCDRYELMDNTLTILQDENVTLKHTYHSELDTTLIEEKARALGMIAQEEAEHITVNVTIPEPEQAPTLWENICWFFEGLFA